MANSGNLPTDLSGVLTAITTVDTVVDNIRAADVPAILAGQMTNKQRAILRADPYTASPLIENWTGIENIETIEENNALTEAGKTRWSSRFPGAGIWTKKATGTFQLDPGKLNYTGANTNKAGLICLKPFRIRQTQYATWALYDERLIYECLFSLANRSDQANFFIGLWGENYLTAVEKDYTGMAATFGSYLFAGAGGEGRIGFAADGDAGAGHFHCRGITNNGATVSNNGALIELGAANTVNHLKLIYKIGTNIEFFLNGASQGIVNTNMVVDDSTNGVWFYPMIYFHGNGGNVGGSVQGIRCYYQNGV